MGLFKRCEHEGRNRDRCEHAWWGSFQHRGTLYRVSLGKWANKDIVSKQQAQVIYERFRQAVREGKVSSEDDHCEGSLTFSKLADLYVERYVKPRRLRTAYSIDHRLKPLREFFGPKVLTEIKTPDVEDFIAELRKPRQVVRREAYELKPASINRHLSLLRHILNWAVAREYLERTPFRRGGEVLVRLLKEDNQRKRRITEDEEEALLEAAAPMLRAMIITALDTGLRRGEMLALRFGDIDWTGQTITLRGETTKSGKTRQIPIGTLRLKAVLEWLRIDGDGEEKKEDVPVFSTDDGEPVGNFRTSWETTVLRAHGVEPRWVKGRTNALTPECQAKFREINLHWHDCRHEYASRLVEKGVVLSQVQALLGHASILTTQRYDNQTFAALQAAAQRLEAGKTFTSASQSEDGGNRDKLEETENPHEDSELNGGEGQNRTVDTTIFSLYLGPFHGFPLHFISVDLR